jgi:DNA-binding response OmpR family regulator
LGVALGSNTRREKMFFYKCAAKELSVAKKILIVDDEELISKMLKKQFESSGFTVIWAKDGQEGLAVAKAEMPNLVILDNMMPKMDGFKVCALLKADIRFKTIPIIMFTARVPTDEDKKLGEEVGFDAYISKFTDFNDLLKKVHELLKED